MSEQHTKEPWKVSGTEHIVAGGNYVVALDCKPKDARRIVAAVNACAGYTTEELEQATLDKRHRHEIIADLVKSNKQIDELSAEVEELRMIIATDTGTESAVAAMQKQRDELLAALQKAADTFWKLNDADIHAQEAEAVIASVKANT